MSPFFEALSRVPDLLAAHLLLAASALALGLVISLPLAIWSARRPTVARIALGYAAAANRRYLTVADVEAADRLAAGGAKAGPIGFLQARK